MDIFQNLQSLLGGGQSAASREPARGAGGGGLSDLLNSQVLGSLAGALFSGKGGGSGLGALFGSGGGSGGAGALGGLLESLLSGGASGLLGGLAGGAPAAAPAVSRQAPVAASDRVMAYIRALVYAAKSDGHIDAREQAAINAQINNLNLGPDGRAMIERAMSESVDPSRIAAGIADGQDAVQIYAMSRAVIDPDQFLEKSYLDGLAKALRIPDNVRAAIDAKLS